MGEVEITISVVVDSSVKYHSVLLYVLISKVNIVKSVPQTDTGDRVEKTKANE